METADILIVDDDPQVAKSISRALRTTGYRIQSARNGEEALQRVSEIAFKVIVSDVKMSKMDGFKLMDEIHKTDADMTRIILSGHSDVELILRLVNEKGIDKYLIKPWENDHLILAIDKCIELYNCRRQSGERPSTTNSES